MIEHERPNLRRLVLIQSQECCQSYGQTRVIQQLTVYFSSVVDPQNQESFGMRALRTLHDQKAHHARTEAQHGHTRFAKATKTRAKQKLTVYYSSVVHPQNPESSRMRAL